MWYRSDENTNFMNEDQKPNQDFKVYTFIHTI